MPTFTGTDGNDTYTGTTEADIINGGLGNDVLNGGDGNDTIDGGAGQDQTFGDAGDDTLVISVTPVGGEIYNGGTGTDTLLFQQSAANPTVNANGPAYNGALNAVTLSSIERIQFGSTAGTGMSVSISVGQNNGALAAAEIVGGAGNDAVIIIAGAGGTYTIANFTYSNWNAPDEVFEQGDGVVLFANGSQDFTLNAGAGHTGVQSLIGSLGNDTLNGTDGMEVLNGGGGVNVLNGFGGDDVLVAVNQLLANGPTFFTFAGSQFNGGDGFDWLSVGGFVDFQGSLSSIEGINFQAAFTLPNGTGQQSAELEIHELSYADAPDDLHLRGTGNLAIQLDEESGFDGSLWVHEEGSNVHIEVFGTDGDEIFIGTTGNDRFSGGFGADTMTGGLGADQFEAGDGQHVVTDFNIAEGDRVDLQDMNIISWEQLQPYLTQVGNDVVFSRLYGGVAQTMTLQNVLLANLTADSFVFQDGDGDEGDTRDGTDEADELIGGNGNDTLNGNGGDDILFGGAGDDNLNGGTGNDLLDGGTGNDFMAGGAGNDVYIVNQGDGFVENADEGTDELRTSVDWGLGDNFENLTATGSGNIFLGGNALANVLTGNSGNNYLVGDGGNDTIDGGAGFDAASFQLPAATTGTLRYIENGDGSFLVQLVQEGGSFETVFEVTLTGAGSAIVTGVGSMSGLGTDTVSNVEELHFLVNTYPDPTPQDQFVNIRLAPFVGQVSNGSAHVSGSVVDDNIDLDLLYPEAAATAQLNADGGLGDDVISGTALGNWMDGGVGDDTLNGRGGSDTLIGSAGNDTLNGGAGNDFLQGGTGNDTLDGGSEQDQAQFYLTANLTGTWSLVKNYGDGSFSVMLTRNGVQEEAFHLTHNAGTWTVVGMNSAAYLGTETLTNVETAGFMFEGPFNNATSLFIQLAPIVAQNGTQLGGLLDDVMDFSGLAGPVTANGNFGNDTITGTNANDNLNGGADNDTLTGLGGNDFLQGQQGDDILVGGDGNDQLRGNAGNDQMSGGTGDDLLGGGAGVDSYDGGTGGEGFFTGYGDRISFYDNTATQGVIADLETGVIANDGFGNAETMTGIESLGGDTAYVDTFYGNEGMNFFQANRGDFIYARGGTDAIALTSAVALADGGDGSDVVWLDYFGGWLSPDSNGDGLAEANAAATTGWTVNVGTGQAIDGYGNVGSIINVEYFSGSALDDTLTGGSGNDELAGHFGDDVIFGGAGNDTLSGDDVYDFVDGVITRLDTNAVAPGGDDHLDGGAGDDTLIGGTGNDLLRGGSGVDSFDGGTGGEYIGNDGYGDRVSFYDRSATAAVVADLRTGEILNDGFGNAETMTGIESLGADTAFADTFHGNDGTNLIFANRGDNLYGYGGDDYFSLTSAAAVVNGGDGTDRLTINVDDGWLAPDTNSDGLAELMAAATAGWTVNLTSGAIIDGYGNVGVISNVENVEGSQLGDVIVGTDGANILEGGGGNDTLRGGEGDDALYGNDGNDFMSQTLGQPYAYSGTYGNDLYDGGAGIDRVSLFTTEGGGVTVDLNVTTAQNTRAAGTDTFIGIEHVTATFGNDILTGTADANWFWTFGGNDTLIGNGGNDYFTVGQGDKVIDGGSDVDTIDIEDDAWVPRYTADGVTISLLLQGQGQETGIGVWTLNNIENLGGSFGSDELTGDGNANVLAGYLGADTLIGGGGNDTLLGDGVWGIVDGVQTLVNETTDGPGGNDILEGGGGNDTLYGGGGNDILRGQAGNDSLYGGSGNDTLTEGGTFGDDLYDGGEGSDRVSFFVDNLSGVTVDLTVAGPQNTGRGTDTFVGVEHITADYGNDTLTGNDATNWFWTFAGNDTLSGNGGDDYFTVGYGTKIIDGGSGNDVLEISDTAYVPMYTIENGVTISLELQGQAQQTNIGAFTLTNIENLSGDVGNDTFIGDANANILAGYSGNDTLRGGAGNDTLAGDGTFELDDTGALILTEDALWATAGNDRLEGGAGDDTLIGGRGNDLLDGGAGLDQAVFAIPGTGSLSIVASGDAQHVMLTVGETQTLVAVIAITNGVLTVTGVGPAAALGTDQLTGVESLTFENDDGDVSMTIGGIL